MLDRVVFLVSHEVNEEYSVSNACDSAHLSGARPRSMGSTEVLVAAVGRLGVAKGWKAPALVHPGRAAAVPPLRLHCALRLGAVDIATGSGCNIRGQGTSAPDDG